MRRLQKLAIVLGLLVLCACATGGTGDQGTADTGSMEAAAGQSAAAGAGPCSNVRCAACPTGQTPALKPPNCCACVPVDTTIRDCSTVRCASCPTGQHPALTPPDCCRCVPD